MIQNPFIIAGRVEKRYFCDRVKETEVLVNRLFNGHNVVLVSPRRMGKTGLIEVCFESEEIKKNFYTFFVDILQTTTLSEFTFLLGKEIYKTLVPRGKRMAKGFVAALKSLSGKISIDNVSGMPSLNIQLGDITQPEVTLDEIFDYLDNADKRCIIAIDEFQQIANYPQKNIEAILRSHIQRSSNCNFIFSGSRRHVLQEMFAGSARPFFNSASFMHLDPIPEPEYCRFIVRLFEERNKRISEEDASEIYGLFEGHTYYVQRMCNEAFNATPTGGECGRETIRRSLEQILDSYDVIYREILSQMPLKQKEVLYAIAKEGKAMAISSENFIRENSLSSASSVQSAVRMLLQKEMITRNESTYTLSDRFFQLWIKRMLAIG